MPSFPHAATPARGSVPLMSADLSNSSGAGSIGIGQPARQQLPLWPQAYAERPRRVRIRAPAGGAVGSGMDMAVMRRLQRAA